MCRLFAVIAEEPVAVRTAFTALKRQAIEHKHGWGIARFDTGAPASEVSLLPANECARFAQLAEELQTRSMLTHLRLASVGEVTEVNAHPFLSGSFAFMHNGTLQRFEVHREALEQRLSPARRSAMRGQTDSERCFALFLTHLDRLPTREPTLLQLAHCLASVIVEVANTCDVSAEEKPSALNFVVTDGQRLVASRRGRTLFHASHRGVRYIASEPLIDDLAWHEVPEDGLVMVDLHEGITERSLVSLLAKAEG